MIDGSNRGERERAHLRRSSRIGGGDGRDDEVVPVESRRRSRDSESHPLEPVRSGSKSSKQENLALCLNESNLLLDEAASGRRRKGDMILMSAEREREGSVVQEVGGGGQKEETWFQKEEMEVEREDELSFQLRNELLKIVSLDHCRGFVDLSSVFSRFP